MHCALCVAMHAQRRYGMADGLPSGQTRQVVCLPSGRMLVQTDQDLTLFDGQRFVPLDFDRRLRVPVESFWHINYYFDGQKRLWLRDNCNLLVFDSLAHQLDATALLAGVTSRPAADGGRVAVRNVCMTPDGAAWVYTADQRLWRCDERDTAVVMTVPRGVRVCDVVQAADRNYALLDDGTMRRLGNGGDAAAATAVRVVDSEWGFLLRGAALDSTHLLLRLHDDLCIYDLGRDCLLPEPLPLDGPVFNMRRVAEGRVLATTPTTVYLITRDGALPLHSVTSKMSSLHGAAYDLYGGLWVCTHNHGVLYYSPYPEIGRWGKAANFVPGLISASTDSRGRTWRTFSDGHIECGTTVWSNLGGTSNQTVGIPFCLEVDTSGIYLTCVEMNRLALFRPPHLEVLSDRYPGLLHYRYVVSACRWGGSIVVATQNGIYSFDCRTLQPDTERFAAWNENPWSDKANCLLADGDSLLWIGTARGLFCMRSDSVWQRVTDDDVQALLFDRSHRMWFSTLDGRVVRLTPSPMVVRTGGTLPFYERRATLTPDGHLEFVAPQGAYTLHPDSVALPALSLTPQLLEASAACVPYDASAVHVVVSALTYGLEDHTVYRYRLLGAEEQWHVKEQTTGNLTIDYAMLPPGRYTLQVQAALAGQSWGGTLEKHIEVTPPWWRSWWSYTLYILLVVLAIVQYVRHQQAQMDNQRKEARIRELLMQVEVQQAQTKVAEIAADGGDEEAATNPVMPLSPAEQDFLARAKECAERHLADSNYSVEDFSSDMAMERTTLYRHLKDTVGQSPLEFLRTVRLRRAATMLQSGRYSVGHVSEMTGFANRSAFARHFKDAYGVLPSAYAAAGVTS